MGNARPKEADHKNLSSSPDKREKFKEQRKAVVNVKKDKEDKALKTEKRSRQPDQEGKLICSEKGKASERSLPENEKEDKENISENDREYSGDTQLDRKPGSDIVKSPQENLREPKRKRGRPPSIAAAGEFPKWALQWALPECFPVTLYISLKPLYVRPPFLCLTLNRLVTWTQVLSGAECKHHTSRRD